MQKAIWNQFLAFALSKKGIGYVKCVIQVCLYFKRVMKELPDVEWVCDEHMSAPYKGLVATPQIDVAFRLQFFRLI